MNIKKKNDPLLKEVALEARNDKIIRFLTKYKNHLIAAVCSIILLVVIFTSYGSYKQSQEEKYSKILHQALIDADSDKLQIAKESLKSIYEDKSSPKNIRSLASLKYAGILLDMGEFDKGISILLKVNSNKNYDQYMRDLSGFLALKSLIDSNDEKFHQRIMDLLVDLKGSSVILKYFIIEQEAVFYWNQKNFKVANEIFKDLSKNPEVSQSVKDRSSEMNRIYIARFGEDEKLPESTKSDKSVN